MSSPPGRPGRPTQAAIGPATTLRRGVLIATGIVAVVLVMAITWALARGLPNWLGIQLDERYRNAVLGAGAVLMIAVGLGLATIARFLRRRVTTPLDDLARLSESVASGDLTSDAAAHVADDEIGRLTTATGAMIRDLRQLALALRASTQDTSALASEITAGSQHMASAAHEMSGTSASLSQQSEEMATTIQAMVGEASQLVTIATELADGAHEMVARSTQLTDLARDNRTRFDASASALEALAEEVRAGAEAAKALATSTNEVRAFVTLVQKMARQSKLLALNASMEAARAGAQGQGFAVVAGEVRRLAASSNEAAERTEAVVNEVLQRVEASRSSSERMVGTVQDVLAATRTGLSSFERVESAMAETASWTRTIESAAERSSGLVGTMTVRLDELANGTQTFAAAMQQVAASSQQQSASTEEIAAAASALAAAAQRLSVVVATFRIGDEASGSSRSGARPSAALASVVPRAPARPAMPDEEAPAARPSYGMMSPTGVHEIVR